MMWRTRQGKSWFMAELERLAARERERRAWLEELADRWQLVRVPEDLTPAEREHQADRIDHAMGLKFHPTYPWPGFTVSVPRSCFASAVGEALEPGGFLRVLTDAMIHSACTNLRRDPDDPYDPHDDPPFTVA